MCQAFLVTPQVTQTHQKVSRKILRLLYQSADPTEMESQQLDRQFWDSMDLIQDIQKIFKENKIQTVKSFVNLNSSDMEILGVKFHSDKLKLLDKQKQYLSLKKGPGGGLRSDLGGLDDDWNKVEEWRKKKLPFQRGLPVKNMTKTKAKIKSFHVSRMTFSKQKHIQCEKGQIPLKIESRPRLVDIKLACYNAFEEEDVEQIPEEVEIFITDNTRKKLISKILNDAQLEAVTSIGYFCKVLEKEEQLSLSTQSSRSGIEKDQTKGTDHHTKQSICSSQHKEVVKKDEKDVMKGILREIHERPLYMRSELPIRGRATPLWDKAAQHSHCKYQASEHVSMDPDIMFKKEDLATVEIQEDDVTIKEIIGKGQFGSVYRGLWKGLQVAVKQIPRGYGEPDIGEVNICRRLRHPNIIMLFGCFISETDINIVTNYIKGINLGVALGLITSKKHKPIDEKYNGFLLYFVAQGMSYLHEKGVIHQDLKPVNIMIEDGSRKPIICDFGVSKLKDVAATNIGGSNAGTLGYQHIEQLHGEKPTPAVDVYSFGVITGEVYSRQPAWKGKKYAEIRMAIESGQYPTFSDVPPECEQIMAKCFKTAKERATFMELLPDLESQSEIDVW